MEENKWIVETHYKFQYGGMILNVFKDGLKVHEQPNLDTVVNATVIGYNFIVDAFLKEYDINWEILRPGRIAFDIGIASRNIIIPGHKEPEESDLDRNIKKFTTEWNKMCNAIHKYL